MEIGRRIIYEKVTGNILQSTGERRGAVIETTYKEDYPEYDPVIMGVIQLSYGEKLNEFINMGSFKVNPSTQELIIYQRFTTSISNEKPAIDETVTIQVSGVELGNVTFTVEGIETVIPPTEGMTSFNFVSDVEGTYEISIATDINGKGAVRLEVIADETL